MKTATQPQPAPPTGIDEAVCDSCGTTGVPMEPVRIPGGATACVDPIACRHRATQAGTWCTYTHVPPRRRLVPITDGEGRRIQ